jgi:hypothetical protein
MRVPDVRCCAIALCCLWGALVTSPAAAADAAPLPAAHAHNDYEHNRPLLDALDNGFCSVEADIWLVDGRLLVAHDRENVEPDRTLEALYLDPLRARIKRNGGSVYRDGPAFTLLIDLKSAAVPTYTVLRDVLALYGDIFTSVRGGEATAGPVTAVLSGSRNKAFEEMIVGPSAAEVRHAGIDGRLSDLDSDVPSHMMPMISDRWTSHFKYTGGGDMPADERDKLVRIVTKAHEHGRRVRFWATPHNEDFWQVLYDAGVDHINADDLERLRDFLTDLSDNEAK